MAEEVKLENDVLFGRLAVKMGFCTPEELVESLDFMKQVKDLGKEVTLGEIMVSKGYLTDVQVDDILTQQGLDNESMIDGYKIIKKLGEGGMGKVFEAMQVSMERPVALKILNRRLSEDKVFVQRFFREAKSAGKLNHPNIVQGIDSGTCRDLHYFAMEYVMGETVDAKIKRDIKIKEKEALEIALGVAQALEHAAKFEIVHRDIKPDNILLGEDDVVKLTDLGLAKKAFDPQITQAGMAMGTPNYISPEQAKADEHIDSRADIYSLGATLFHMLVGEVPFAGSSIEVILTKHVIEAPRSVRSLAKELSQEVDDLVTKMMAKNPNERYQTPTDLIVEIKSVLEGTKKEKTLKEDDQQLLERLRQERKSSNPVTVKSETVKDLPGGKDLLEAKLKTIQKKYEANTIVFYEGQESDKAYLLLRGELEILRAGRVIYTIKKSGTYFGEISLLKNCPREYTARATKESLIVELSRSQYIKILQSSTKLCIQLVERMADLLSESDGVLVLREQKLEATRSQLKNHLSREGEVASMLKEVVKAWYRSKDDPRKKAVFHEVFEKWMTTYHIIDYAKMMKSE